MCEKLIKQLNTHNSYKKVLKVDFDTGPIPSQGLEKEDPLYGLILLCFSGTLSQISTNELTHSKSEVFWGPLEFWGPGAVACNAWLVIQPCI